MACENEITDLFCENSAAKSYSAPLKSRSVVSCNRKDIGGSTAILHSSKILHMRRIYYSSHIWMPMTKRQKRYLELSAQIIWSSRRYFVGKLDVCSTEYPAQLFLEVKYEEKGRGEDLYGGGRRPGTGWVEGGDLSGSKFDQKIVGGSY